jgi:hypothetical protein
LKKGKKGSFKNRKKAASSSGGTLTALIEMAPAYGGSSSPFGAASISCNEDGSFLFHIDADGLDTVCTSSSSCKVAVYDGISCDAVGSAHYNDLEYGTDPWSLDGENTYFTSGGGSTSSAFNFDNGYTCDANEGKVVVAFDSDGTTIAGCGVLGEKAKESVLKAEMGLYPNYTGDLEAEGEVTVTFNDDHTFQFRFDIKGLEADCVDCGIHIHTGTSCATHEEVSGHYWNTDVVRDLWTAAGGAVYNTDEKGKDKGSYNLYNGYGVVENNHHAVVIHLQDGTRAACGVLEFES